jgi:hypothetical protein
MSIDLSTLTLDELAEHFWCLNDQYLYGPVKLNPISLFTPLRDEWNRRGITDTTTLLEAAAARLGRWS